jgi:hypothetical protein
MQIMSSGSTTYPHLASYIIVTHRWGEGGPHIMGTVIRGVLSRIKMRRA